MISGRQGTGARRHHPRRDVVSSFERPGECRKLILPQLVFAVMALGRDLGSLALNHVIRRVPGCQDPIGFWRLPSEEGHA